MEALYISLIMGVGIGLHCLYEYDTGNVFVTVLCATLFVLPVAALLQLVGSIIFNSYTTIALFLLWWVLLSVLSMLQDERSVDTIYLNAVIAIFLVWMIYWVSCGGFDLVLSVMPYTARSILKV